MTYSHRSDIKIARGEQPNKTQTKVQHFVRHFETIRHPWRTQCNACNDRLNLSNHFTADNGVRTGFIRSAMHVMHVPQGCRFFVFKVQTKMSVISNERKQIYNYIYYLIFLSRGYTLSVMIELIHW